MPARWLRFSASVLKMPASLLPSSASLLRFPASFLRSPASSQRLPGTFSRLPAVVLPLEAHFLRLQASSRRLPAIPIVTEQQDEIAMLLLLQPRRLDRRRVVLPLQQLDLRHFDRLRLRRRADGADRRG